MKPYNSDPLRETTRRAALGRCLHALACLSLLIAAVGCSDDGGTDDDYDEAVQTYDLINHVITGTLYRIPGEHESIVTNAVDNGWLDSDNDVSFDTFRRLVSTGSRKLEMYLGIQRERDYTPAGDLESDRVAETYEPYDVDVLIEMVVSDTLFLSSERDTLIADADDGGEETDNAAHDIDSFMSLATTQARVDEIVDELEIPDEHMPPTTDH